MSDKKQKNETMYRDDIIEVMKYLGWITHDEKGELTDEVFHVARELSGKITYGIMAPSDIATAVDRFRNKQKYIHKTENI